MIRVFIIDDHPLIRKGIRETIAETSDMQVIGEASNAESALSWLANNSCDVVTLDLSLPDLHGLELLEQIKEKYKTLPILVLTMYNEEHYARQALKLGAAGFLPKDSPPITLVEAIRKVRNQGRYLPHELAEKLAFSFEKSDKLPHEILSNRELTILRMIGAGKTTREIGEILSISAKTVSTYRTRIMTKLNKKTNAELIKYCIKHRLVEDNNN